MKDKLKALRKRIPNFGSKEFNMADFIKFIRGENEHEEKIKLWYLPSPYNGMILPPDILLETYEIKTTVYHIVLHDKMDLIDQEFTMGHELGHYLLGHSQKDIYYGKMSGDRAEVEANLICFMFKLPGKLKEFGDFWEIILEKQGGDFAYELINNLMDNLKDSITELKKIQALPLLNPYNQTNININLDRINMQIDNMTKISKLREIIITILDTYPK